jgi:hypothetical protein
MASANLLDTNVVFDLIYPDRPRYKKALEFYKNFKNLELSIEPKVNIECQRVTVEFIGKFSTDLENFLSHRNQRSKRWDQLNPKQRSDALNDFLNTHSNNNNSHAKDILSFYTYTMKTIRSNLVHLNYIEVKEYLLNLSSELLGNLRQQIFVRFSYIIPYYAIDKEEIIRFIDSLRESILGLDKSFSSSQKEDFNILVSLIQIYTFGDSESRRYDSLLFYTNDENFLKSFNKLKNSDPSLNEKLLDGYLKKALEFISFEKPY